MRALARDRAGTAAGAVLAAAGLVWVLRAPGYWVFTANAGLILAVATLGLMVVVGWIKEVSLVQAGLTGTAGSGGVCCGWVPTARPPPPSASPPGGPRCSPSPWPGSAPGWPGR